MSQELRILTPQGMLGYGVPAEHFWRGIDSGVDAMIVDSGSTDPGPYLLGLGKTIVTREAYARDVSLMLKAAHERKIPLIISSAGGAGTDAQVDFMIDLIRELSAANGYKFKLAAIYSSVDRAMIHARLREGRITECGPSGNLEPAAIDEAVEIVAQIGAEPFVKVLTEHPEVDIIVSGRSYDPAPHAALCITRGDGIEPGTYWHMGKIVECGATCAEPKGRVIKATVRKGSFDLEPMNPAERCTPLSVAAHTLYEKSRPDILPGPGGALHLAKAQYEALDNRRTRVSGGVFVPTNKYSVKLEGASIIGYRTIFIGGLRDPVLIGQLDAFLAHVRKRAESIFPQLVSGEASMMFHVYGRDAVMGEMEPLRHVVPHEVGLMGEVTAPTQELANDICNSTRIAVLHSAYPGQMATAGNFAIPLNPPETPTGPVCRFSVYHLMEVDSPTDMFPIRYMEI
jgi:hypothetical protein